jgi:NAD(P)-dependent dehydrogenase (short-subunit alcohol dehydrogenase family)
MEERTLVLGTGDGNIGQAIVKELNIAMLVDGKTVYDSSDVPTSTEMYAENYKNLVVSCGFTRIEAFHQQDPAVMQKIIAANLTTPLKAIRNFIEANIAHIGECCVIVIGSYAHNHVLSNSVAYCAAKAGISHAVQCLAWDYTAQGFRFHCIHPHSVADTPMTSNVIREIKNTKGMTTDEAVAYWKRTLLLPNRLTKAEVAETVLWLMKEAPTAHLSGSSIELYGGER